MGKDKNKKVGPEITQPSPTQVEVSYVKLNPVSSYFYDPTSGLKLLPGRMLEVTPAMLASKRFKYAVTNGQVLIEKSFKEIDDTINSQINLDEEFIKARKVYDDSDVDNIMDNFKEQFSIDILKDLSTIKLGLTVPEDATDEEVIDEIVAAFDIIVEEENK